MNMVSDTRVVNLARSFASFTEHWSPRIAGELNGQHVKLAKLQGEFVWHHHEHEDEMFLVIKGELVIELKPPHETVTLHEGEFAIIPRGVEHRPVAHGECHVLLFEPASTLNTGNVRDERTIAELKRL